jgi:chaperone required for assembly of F1-ATPase
VAGGGGLALAAEVDAARRGNSGLAAADSTRERRQEMEAEWGLEVQRRRNKRNGMEGIRIPRLLMGRKIQGPATRPLVVQSSLGAELL